MSESKVNQELEIDILELLKIVWKRRFWIAGFVALVCVFTVVYVMSLDNIYQSSALLKPTSKESGASGTLSKLGGLASFAGVDLSSGVEVSSYDIMRSLLNDTSFIAAFIEENQFESKFFTDYEELAKNEGFLNNKNYYIKETSNNSLIFRKDSDTGIITIAYKNKDREFAKIFLDKILLDLSTRYKEFDIGTIQRQIDNYKVEIDRTNDISIKNSLAQVVSGLIQKKILSQAQEYYGFNILIKAKVADKLDKVEPRRSIICIQMFILSLFVSVLLVFVIESIMNMRKRVVSTGKSVK